MKTTAKLGMPPGLLGAVAVALVSSCSSSDAEPTPDAPSATFDAGANVAAPTGLPCAVNQVLSTNCQTCHTATPKAGASVSLVTWDDLQKERGGKKVYELVKERVHAETQQMPPAKRLSAAELATLDDWIAAGAPKSDAACNAEGPPPATRPFECPAPATTTILKAAKPFTWATKGTDQYMCFGVDEIVNAKKHVIAFGPKADNLDILHHILLFQNETGMSNEAQPCSATTSASWKLVTGWAPGGNNFVLPPEAGVPEQGTTHWILQVHYNNASGKFDGATDDSGYQLCSTDQLRPNDAGFIGAGSISFNIPARTAKHRIKCDYRLGPKYKDAVFFRAWPHMHTLGAAMSTERLVGGKGTPELLYSQDPFNFENQESHPVNMKVDAGDVLRTRCTWKNPGDKAVGFGEKTGDEMCFDFLSYYPAIPNEGWVTPSLLATCTDDN